MSEPDPAPAAAGAKNAFTKKIGPLPVGVWVAVIGAGAAIAYFVNRGAASSAAAATDGEFTDRLDNTMPGAGNLGLGGGNALLDAAQSLTGAYSSNEAWQQAALRRLISSGDYDATTVDGALRAYLAGNTLTQAQAAILDVALTKVGPPPVSPPLPASGQLVEAKPKPTATPTQEEQGKDTPNQASAFYEALITPAPTSAVGSSITTNYSSPTSSIYNVSVGGVSTPIPESLVWSGAFSGGQVPSGYSAAEAAAIRDALQKKGLAS